MKHHKSPKLAFSLIELSVVILVIGLLVIGITKGSSIIKKAKLTSAQSLTRSSPVALTSNLVAWFETTLDKSFTDSEKVDTALTAEGTISTWNNVNPHIAPAVNATQATDTNKPRYVASGINGLPVLNFDGTDDFFSFDGTALANSNYTVFVVEQRRSDRGANYFIAGDTTGINKMLILGYVANDTAIFAQIGNSCRFTVPVYAPKTPAIHTFRFSSTIGKNYYLNGASQTRHGSAVETQGLVSSATQGLVSYDGAKIGGHLRLDSFSYYDGDIAEIIMFNKYVNDSEREDIEEYLSTKWGI